MIDVARKYLNIPLAIQPERTDFLAATSITDTSRQDADIKPYAILDGIAIIPVSGLLVQKLGSLSPCFGMTGYDGLRCAITMALTDTRVKGILLDIDSPGGEVAGCFDLCDFISESRAVKPFWAACNEHAYSAAYAIASSCDVITVPRTGGVGSIGVITLHVDLSKMLDEQGVKVSIIKFGDRKADGNETQPLSGDARARLQADIDSLGELFCSTVARNRGVSLDSIINMQAGTFLGRAGVLAGLADEVASHDEAFGLFALLLNR